MKRSKLQITIRLANGKVFQVTDPSTKQLDPKLKKASTQRAIAIVKGMKAAGQKAKKLGVPLSEVLPVS